MDDISIDFIKELAEYDDAFAKILEQRGMEDVCNVIVSVMQGTEGKTSDKMREWKITLTDISQSKQKISEQKEDIRKRIEPYWISNTEYNEIMEDTDVTRKNRRLQRFLTERMSEIHGVLLSSDNLDKRVHQLGLPDEMLEMRKDIYVDRKNIAEALSILFLEDDSTQKMIRLMLEKMPPEKNTGQDIETIFQSAMVHMLAVLLSIEQYQKDGLLSIRHLEELDRQIVFMLVMLALKKHPNQF